MKTILFICVHNSGRSQMAEAYFNWFAKSHAQAESAGTQPGESINPVVVQAMQEDGIDISQNRPKILTPEMVARAYKVISMGCGAEVDAACPARYIETQDWPLEDPRNKPIETVRIIRDNIKSRVIEFINKEGFSDKQTSIDV
ncbi:MAG: arsenate reductase ArsC [Dehalococcoidaceae bacterium]|nr:arsenate reductase ArsC [Dehalococcoidaceae bacterium]